MKWGIAAGLPVPFMRVWFITLGALAGLATSALLAGPAQAHAPQALNTATMSVSTLKPKPGWVHWTGAYYSCWIPSKKWQVVESAAGITISSPTGDNYVEFGWSSWMVPLAPQEVIDNVFVQGMLHPLVSYQVTSTSAVQAIPQGQRQMVEWSGIWSHQLKGQQRARGYIIADTMDYGGSYGFSAYVVAGAASTWKRNAITLETIRQNIVFMGNG